MNLTVAIVTPTTNNPLLRDCVRSVDDQTYPCHHYLWADGVVSYEEVFQMGEEYRSKKRDIAYWPGKIGGPGLEGRRLVAAAPSLINEDIFITLNEDDWFKPNHVESLVTVIEQYGLDWAYCLRSIYDRQGNFLFEDNCESLGIWSVWRDDNDHLVESCSYAIRTSIMRNFANVYNYRGWGPDRLLYKSLAEKHPTYACTGLHTMCFRLGGNPTSVSREFLEEGNRVMRERYPGGFPWHGKQSTPTVAL